MRLPRSGRSSETLWASSQLILLLRWVLIVSTSYLVLFSRPLGETPPAVSLFVALYLGTNLVLTLLVSWLRERGLFEWIVVAVDTAAISCAMLLAGNASSDFFVLYFVVLFVSALSERIGLVAVATLLVVTVYVYTTSQHRSFSELVEQGYMVRIPFLLVVALFFGNLVQGTRQQERRAEEERARALRMELLSGVTHDIKNPLAVIESLASLLLEGDAGVLNEQQTQLTKRIHASARHLFSLSQNLLDAERIEAGRLVLQRRATDLRAVVGNVLDLAQSAGQLKSIVIESEAEPGLPRAWVDPLQTERVVANLVGNAIKFTPAGGSVTLSLRRRDSEVVLAVSDDGPGIDCAQIAGLFEKYHREIESLRPEGSGLGLFIVRALVEAQGGAVAIASTPGCGTTVTVTLPVFDGARAVAGSAPLLEPAPSAALPSTSS